MNFDDLSSLEEYFKEYVDQKGNENDYFLGDLFRGLHFFRKDHPDVNLIEILKTSLELIEYVGYHYKIGDYIDLDNPSTICVNDNPHSITHIRTFFKELSEEKKMIYWEFSIKSDCFMFLEPVIHISRGLNLKVLLIRGRIEKWIDQYKLKFFSRIFISEILYKFMRTSKNIFLETSILMKNIIIPQINSIPSGEIEFNKINIFIGQNNQSKSRFLKFIKVLLLAFGDLHKFSQKFSGHRFAENYDDDQEIKKIFEQGFTVGIEIKDKVKTEEIYFLWGWEFPMYEHRILNLEIAFHHGFSNIKVLNCNISEIPSEGIIQHLLRSNIQFIYIDETATISQDEEFPINGWIRFNEEEAIKDIIGNFRRILAYNKWLISNKYQNLEFLQTKVFDAQNPSEKFFISLKSILEKWRIISQIFFLGENYEEFFGISDIIHYPTSVKYLHQLNVVMEFLSKYKLVFNIIFDENINRFKLARDGVVTEGADISKQGHGIRTMALVFLASIFCNFILIDEPENGLHLSLQRSLAAYLLEIYSNQVFIVTHSPSMIPHNSKANVFLVHNKRIILKELYPEKWTDSHQFIAKNLNQIRNIIGGRPEDLLFERAIIYFEGRTDISFYSGLFLDYGIKLDKVKGVSNLKAMWKNYREFLSKNINENIIFVFDRDYFNELIAKTDNINGFTLPCYSFENLLLDPFFLSSVFSVDELIIRRKLLELIEDNKSETLDKLFIAHLFHTLEGVDAIYASKKLREDINVNWGSLNPVDLPDLLYELWSTADESITKEEVIKSGYVIKTICQNWQIDFIYYNEMKNKANNYLAEIYENCLNQDQKKQIRKPTINQIKRKYIEFVKDIDDLTIPNSLTKDFIKWYKEIIIRIRS